MRLFTLAAAAAFAIGGLAAHAETITFSFSGTDVTGSGGTSTGTGAISFDGAPTSISLGSLTGFTFSQITSVPEIGTATFDYSLSDLTLFSATLNGSTLSGLQLNTIPVTGSLDNFIPESFHVTSLGSGGAYTSNDAGVELQVGTVVQTGGSGSGTAVTPEPSSLALLGTGLLGTVAAARRRYA